LRSIKRKIPAYTNEIRKKNFGFSILLAALNRSSCYDSTWKGPEDHYAHRYKHLPVMHEGPAESTFLQTAGYVTAGQSGLLKALSRLTNLMRED
jgi:hypothetical protein